MGWDVRRGLAAGGGSYLAIIDGDGQMPGGDVVRVFRATVERSADVGMTYRTTRDDGALRRLLSTGFNLLFRTLFPGTGIHDVNSKPKVFRRDALERMQLESTDWFIDAEMMIASRRLGLAVVELPTGFGKLANRTSFVRFAAVLEFVRNLIHSRIREWRR
jgi:hypothetical protein